MDMGDLDQTAVRLIPDKMEMRQQVNMPIFRITNWAFDFEPDGKGVQVVIVMKRKITTELMTTFFPSLLLIAITFATTFFKPFFFEAALSVNLTTMLLMTTIFMSKMEGLPPTSDIKMIDIWLVLCQMVPFAEVVLLTAKEYQRKETHEEVKDIISVIPFIDEEHEEETQKQGSKHRKCWSLKLETVGKFILIFCILINSFHLNFIFFSSEKTVLPLVVVASFVVYFGIAAIFYFKF